MDLKLWLKERELNARQIASRKTIADRSLWIEDSNHFKAAYEAIQLAELKEQKPIDMVLHCPACGTQHVDAPDERTPGWVNEPHRSHLCHNCWHIWRPADVPTNGVAAIKTKGKADSPVAATAQPVHCQTCNDTGMIGGPSFYAPDEGGVPCPDCSQPDGMRPLDLLTSIWNAMQNSADGDDLLNKLEHMRDSIERAVQGDQQQALQELADDARLVYGGYTAQEDHPEQDIRVAATDELVNWFMYAVIEAGFLPSEPDYETDLSAARSVLERLHRRFPALPPQPVAQPVQPSEYVTMDEVLDLAMSLYARQPTYRGTIPLSWSDAPEGARQEWLEESASRLNKRTANQQKE